MVMVKEMFPVNQQESDAAAKLRVELLAEVVDAVGPEAFLAAVKKAISISKGRYDCTVSRIRDCAGLQHVPDPSPAMKAWATVTEIVQRHVREAPEGGIRLEPYVYRRGDEVLEVPVPAIPEPMARALRSLGGWKALMDTEPAYWSQRMRDFCGAYQEESSLKRDCDERRLTA